MRLLLNILIPAFLVLSSVRAEDYFYNVLCEYEKASAHSCKNHQDFLFKAMERAIDQALVESKLKRVDTWEDVSSSRSEEGKHRKLGCSAYQIRACDWACGWNDYLCYQVHNCEDCGYRQRNLRRSAKALSERELQNIEEMLEFEVEAALKVEALNDRKQKYPKSCVTSLKAMTCQAHVA